MSSGLSHSSESPRMGRDELGPPTGPPESSRAATSISALTRSARAPSTPLFLTTATGRNLIQLSLNGQTQVNVQPRREISGGGQMRDPAFVRAHKGEGEPGGANLCR